MHTFIYIRWHIFAPPKETKRNWGCGEGNRTAPIEICSNTISYIDIILYKMKHGSRCCLCTLDMCSTLHLLSCFFITSISFRWADSFQLESSHISVKFRCHFHLLFAHTHTRTHSVSRCHLSPHRSVFLFALSIYINSKSFTANVKFDIIIH